METHEAVHMKVLALTTFHQAGLEQYGQRMIDTFAQNVDEQIDLIVYTEDCTPTHPQPTRIQIVDAKAVLPKLNAFKAKWKDEPKANGICPPEIKARRPRDWHKKFKWDAIRFANKVYAVYDACTKTEYDLVIWIDGDTVCHSPITQDRLVSFFPEQNWLAYLGRGRKWPECGFYALYIKQQGAIDFLKEFERVYEDADNGIFKMEEWHDSYVFDEVLKKIRLQHPNITDLSGHLVKGEGHPLINTELGAYFDHLKGARKEVGKSKLQDLFRKRHEEYWKDAR